MSQPKLIFGVLKRVPEGERPEGLKVSRDLLPGEGHRTVISRLPAAELYNPDGPWHLLLREQFGEDEYRVFIAKLEAGLTSAFPDPSARAHL